ncbi:MAG: hypothetical protein AABW99_02240 [archaeon]
MDKERVAIGLPIYKLVPSEFFKSFFVFSGYMQKNHSPAMIIIDNMYISMARQQTLNLFLESDCEYLFFLDSDMVFPPNIFDLLKEKDEDIISALYFSRNDPENPVFRIHKDGKVMKVIDYPENRIFKVDSVGMGCCLIKRKVIEKMTEDNPGKFLFDTPQIDKNNCMGEDVFFCNLATKSGFEVKVDSSIIVGHVGGVVTEIQHKAARENILKEQKNH